MNRNGCLEVDDTVLNVILWKFLTYTQVQTLQTQ